MASYHPTAPEDPNAPTEPQASQASKCTQLSHALPKISGTCTFLLAHPDHRQMIRILVVDMMDGTAEYNSCKVTRTGAEGVEETVDVLRCSVGGPAYSAAREAVRDHMLELMNEGWSIVTKPP